MSSAVSGPYEPSRAGGLPGRLPLPPELSPRRGGAGYPPPPTGRRWARVISWTAVFMSGLVLVLSGGAYAYYLKLNGNINRISVFGHNGKRPARAADGAENILLVGSDSRVGATPAQLAREHTTADGGGVNTDTIIIVHLAPRGGPATMISIPRDSYVAIPGHGTFKINSAFSDGEADHPGGGPGLLVQTIENLTGLHIDHFIEVNFLQFINITNAIGGVRVCLTMHTHDPTGNTALNLGPGTFTLDGEQALQFVRQRHGFPGDTEDFGRISRQQRFATALVHKARSIRNPATLNALLEQVTKSLTVDSGLSGLALLNLADRLKNLDPTSVHFAVVPVAKPNAYANGVSYVELDMPRLQQFFANIQAERDPNYVPPATTVTVTPVPPSQVHLSVLNGSGVNGAAGRTRTALAGFGFQVDSIGTTSPGSTVIRYGPGAAGAAGEVARAVPGATTVADTTLPAGGVVLVVGTNFSHVQNPSVTASAAAPSATGSSPAATASPNTAAATDCGP